MRKCFQILFVVLLGVVSSCHKEKVAVPAQTGDEVESSRVVEPMDFSLIGIEIRDFSKHACVEAGFERPGVRCTAAPGECKKEKPCEEVPPALGMPPASSGYTPTATDIDIMAQGYVTQMLNDDYIDVDAQQYMYDFVYGVLWDFYYP